MELRDNTAIVVGASSGIGEAVAWHLARDGYTVALLARRADELERVKARLEKRFGEGVALCVPHDVTDFDAVPALFDQLVEQLGGLALVVYAAGIMPRVEPEEYSFAKDKAMVDVNLLGMMAWLNQAADFFARVRGGAIVGIGSIAGDRGRKGQPGYNTSKGAQAIFLEALRNRLAEHDVRVVTIKPGYVETAMTAGMGELKGMISAHEAGRAIVAAAHRSRGTVYVPTRWALVGFVIRHIPSFLFRRLGI
jgi:short-subunit dehydrogenase